MMKKLLLITTVTIITFVYGLGCGIAFFPADKDTVASFGKNNRFVLGAFPNDRIALFDVKAQWAIIDRVSDWTRSGNWIYVKGNKTKWVLLDKDRKKHQVVEKRIMVLLNDETEEYEVFEDRKEIPAKHLKKFLTLR